MSFYVLLVANDYRVSKTKKDDMLSYLTSNE